MLVGKQCGGHQNNHLFAAGDHRKGGAHGYFGFTKAHITAYQAIHWLRAQQVAAHCIYGLLLIGGFLKGEVAAKFAIVLFIFSAGKAFARGATGVDIQ